MAYELSPWITLMNLELKNDNANNLVFSNINAVDSVFENKVPQAAAEREYNNFLPHQNTSRKLEWKCNPETSSIIQHSDDG
jgi:hypothetical protein